MWYQKGAEADPAWAKALGELDRLKTQEQASARDGGTHNSADNKPNIEKGHVIVLT